MLYPRDHLIRKGFDDGWFCVEFKSFGGGVKHRRQLTKLSVQAVSYSQSEFRVGGEYIRPMFCLTASDMHIHPMRDDHAAHWIALCQILQYFNVGQLYAGDGAGGWEIRFSGGRYFCSLNGKGKIANIGTKRYAGNPSR